ncbi:glycosyltransferase [Mesoflavibacter zeaxanthinifaciens]|uniref:glycosyltransferase n=1 Tax=Mesoflavibacter zeaxanthinifaciens TaxID=393060 RepID=UPI003A9158E1
MKTIMILVDQFYLHGGIEKLVSIKANYWANQSGYKVIIVSTDQQNRHKVYNLSDKVKFIDLNINYKRAISFFHPKNLGKLIKNVKRVKQVVKNQDPDLILVASHIPMTYLLPFINTKVPIAKEFHFSKYTRTPSKKNEFFEKIESRYDWLIVLSEEEKQFFSSDNVVVIPNPIEVSSNIEIYDLKNKGKVAGAILRFAPVKQLDKMVTAWEMFYQKNRDWKLYVYGNTQEGNFNEIEALVREKKLKETIVFKGKTDNIYKALEEIGVLLMTSANECFPMVILEANSCGVPVVSFDSPTGPRNIINHNIDGVIVPHNDIYALAEQLHEVVNNKERLLKLSRNALINSRLYQLDKIMSIWQTKIIDKI